MRRVLAVTALVLGWSLGAAAADLHLDGDRYWIALASHRSLNEAVGIARWYAPLSPSVARTTDGSFAVLVGPRTIETGHGPATLDALIKAGTVPADAALTHGDGYAELVWTTPPSPIIATARYDGRSDATAAAGALRVTVSKVAAEGGGFAPTATGTRDGTPVFVFAAGSDHPTGVPAAQVTLVKLDRGAAEPQIVLSYFWQGQHCCTLTRIATEHADGTWHVVDGEVLQGDGGYRLEDLTGTGEVELTSPDQAFFTFAPSATPVAPTRIHQLVGDRLVDVTSEPRFYDVLLQNVAALESSIKPDDPAWHDNGFLAGWVAEKMLVGQGAEAWARMLAQYDRKSDAGAARCTVDQPIARCPEDRKARMPFPIALKAFLIERGYILDAALYPLPKSAAAAPAASPLPAATAPPSGIPPELQRCVADSDSARRLLYQAFVGRRLQPGEGYEPVTLEADTTLEANDLSIARIVCAVTYDVDLKALSAQLAARGEVARAAAIDKMIRRLGPTTTARIKYSVKPTATPGQNYVELLP